MKKEKTYCTWVDPETQKPCGKEAVEAAYTKEGKVYCAACEEHLQGLHRAFSSWFEPPLPDEEV